MVVDGGRAVGEVSVMVVGFEEVLLSRADLRCGSVEVSLACL